MHVGALTIRFIPTDDSATLRATQRAVPVLPSTDKGLLLSSKPPE
jgi:hypothetical protein